MKQVVTLALAILAWGVQPAWSEEGVPMAQDLTRDAVLAREKRGVVLVMFSGERCAYCLKVLDEFLIPMSRNADYQAKMVTRKVILSNAYSMKDFQGRAVTQKQFAKTYGVNFVPTIMAFDADGAPLGKPLVGLTTVDYYGAYLDELIDAGLAVVRK
ncbi:MAG: thioredoxin fold domain-containing protein [Betaproteobacteria bacterium]|nr:thioredoxin fold domain-containing protein [Betaproteobacteria bacterium]